jgi:thioredoxin-like negative regulator of GroEL
MAYLHAGNAMMKQQKFGAAVVMLRQALIRVGDKPEIYKALSEALTNTDDLEGAVAVLEKLSRLESASTEDKAWSQHRITELQARKK